MALAGVMGGADSEISESTTDILLESAQFAPLAVRATKEVARRGQELPFVDAIRFGETMRKVTRATADAKVGPAAFREKQTPTWTGQE